MQTPWRNTLNNLQYVFITSTFYIRRQKRREELARASVAPQQCDRSSARGATAVVSLGSKRGRATQQPRHLRNSDTAVSHVTDSCHHDITLFALVFAQDCGSKKRCGRIARVWTGAGFLASVTKQNIEKTKDEKLMAHNLLDGIIRGTLHSALRLVAPGSRPWRVDTLVSRLWGLQKMMHFKFWFGKQFWTCRDFQICWVKQGKENDQILFTSLLCAVRYNFSRMATCDQRFAPFSPTFWYLQGVVRGVRGHLQRVAVEACCQRAQARCFALGQGTASISDLWALCSASVTKTCHTFR